MVENQLPEEVVQKLDPNRRKFILGILAAGITAPTVASFVMGKAKKSAMISTPIRPASIIDASGNFQFTTLFSGNSYGSSANYIYESYLSGNFLRDASGNYLLDASGNLLCGTSGNILLDASGNALPDPSGNYPYLLDPSGNWNYQVSSNSIGIPLRDPSGNFMADYLRMDPSGNVLTDPYYWYDSNGVVDYSISPQIPGIACVVSANHIQQVQGGSSSTSSVAPSSTEAPTTTNAPANQNGTPSATTTTVPVSPIVPNGSIPATK